MSTAEQPLMTPTEYLEFERASEIRHEYFRGEVFAMSGASRNHNRLTVNLAGEFHAALKQSPCEIFASDMRVKVSATGLYTYPDIVGTCEQPQFEDKHLDTLLNPQLVIEVLSDSTETYDRGRKFRQYRSLESLKDYVLVSQQQPSVELYSRRDDGTWVLRPVIDLQESVTLPSIGVTLQLADIYARVEFETPTTEATDQ